MMTRLRGKCRRLTEQHEGEMTATRRRATILHQVSSQRMVGTIKPDTTPGRGAPVTFGKHELMYILTTNIAKGGVAPGAPCPSHG